MDSPATVSAASLGDFLVIGVHQIDLLCRTVIGNLENGLCNVTAQFGAEALADTGCRLSEEPLISWLLAKRLREAGVSIAREHLYPGTREKCDLVITLADETRFWVEVKIAWKHWFSSHGKPKTSWAYRGYLFGDDSHPGTAHDFEKLERVCRPDAHALGILLIGFDSDQAPMASDVDELVGRGQMVARGWSLTSSDRWMDRRNPSFGIGAWFWQRDAAGPRSDSSPATPVATRKFTLDNVVRAFNAIYPNRSAYEKLTFKPLLQELRIAAAKHPEIQDRIRTLLGRMRNDKDWLYGDARSASAFDALHVGRRREACEIILRAINGD